MPAEPEDRDRRLLIQFQRYDRAAEREMAARVLAVTEVVLRVRRGVENPADREDVVQEVAERTLRALRKGRPRLGVALDGWIWGIARNKFLTVRERLWRHNNRERPTDLPPQPQLSADFEERTALRSALDDAVQRLPPPKRLALVYRYGAGLSDREIVAILGCRESTLSSHFSRALQRLSRDPALQDWADSPRKEDP